MKAVELKALPHYKLFLSFDDGVCGTIDLSSMVEKGIFQGLKDEASFNKVYLTGYSIAWSGELEIDLLSVYAELAKRKPEEFMSANSQYAAD